MSSTRKNKGLNIGAYRITPIGIAVFAVIIIAIVGIVVYFAIGAFGNSSDNVSNPGAGTTAAPVASPTATADNGDVITVNTPTPPPPTAEPTSEPTPTPVANSGPATIRVIGEIAIDDNILSSALEADGSYSFGDMFSSVAGAVGDADFTIADVEGALGGAGNAYSGKNEYITPASLIGDLSDIGVDMLALANDHALDCFFDGILDTIANCNEYGMNYVGAAATQAEHDTPKVVKVNGVNIGFLNYTTTLNSKEKATSADAIAYGVNLVSESNCVKDIKALKNAGADVVVCIMSWSKDGATEAAKGQKTVIKALAKAGVDVIIGYGTRTIQPVGWIEQKDSDGNVTHRTLCVCSVGTFLSDSTDCGTIFEFTITPQDDGTFSVDAPKSIPTYVWRYSDGSSYSYRVLACGEWIDEQPVGMDDTSYNRMMEIWEKTPSQVTDSSTVTAN